LPGLTWNLDPLDLSFPSSWDYRHDLTSSELLSLYFSITFAWRSFLTTPCKPSLCSLTLAPGCPPEEEQETQGQPGILTTLVLCPARKSHCLKSLQWSPPRISALCHQAPTRTASRSSQPVLPTLWARHLAMPRVGQVGRGPRPPGAGRQPSGKL
jgi:hypothetical protein